MSQSLVFLLLCILSFEANRTLSQDAVSTTPMTMAEQKVCPFLLITPHTLQMYQGKTATFEVAEEAKVHSAIDVRWQKSKYDLWHYVPYVTYLNITDRKYHGSVLFHYPKLVINDAEFEDEGYYRIQVRIREGWCNSGSVYFRVGGSLKFLDPCNKSRECVPDIGLECHNNVCLCSPLHYHKNGSCYDRQRLRAQDIQLESSTCNISLKWKAPERDKSLVVAYYVVWEENRFGHWDTPMNVSVGDSTDYQSKCNLLPGRLYRFRVRVEIHLTNPDQTVFVDSFFTESETILEPLPPGPVSDILSNYSADNLYLRWNASEFDSFVNRYKISIDGHDQTTDGNEPEIHWNELLEPHKPYNVSIIAISFGYTVNYPLNGSRESRPSVKQIVTEDSHYSGKAFMPYSNEDFILTGDDVTGDILRSPTTVYIGDGSVEGFTFVKIGSNGVIGLGNSKSDFNDVNVHELTSKKLKNRQILCPFWTDMLTSDTDGKVYYNHYKRINDKDTLDSFYMDKADSIVKKYFKDFKEFSATWALKVTWENMTLFADRSERVTVQCLLITDGENTFTVMNYIDVNIKPIKNPKIAIGYRYQQFSLNNMYSLQKAACSMSDIPGNRGEPGVWIYKLTDNIQSKRDEKSCFQWYTNNKHRADLNPSLECPCDSGLLRFDPRFDVNRFDSENRLLCYASLLLKNNIECCYQMYADTEHLGALERSKPLAGTVLSHNPFFERFIYKNNDLLPRMQCCKTGHCDWYFEVRKIPNCYIRSPFQPGINFGDPHITTLDGLDYTFNGYGEYIMLTMNTGSIKFDLQARTDLVSTENGTIVNATIFSAFVAMDQTGSVVQVELSKNKSRMIVHVNNNDLTTSFQDRNYSHVTQNLSMRWENESLSATFLQSAMNIKISIGQSFLICETLVNQIYKNQTRGLMGNFDGDKSNDFVLPNGTILNENQTKTERQIYYNFGQLWSVGNRSLFKYNDGLSHINFSHPEFQPIFAEEDARLDDAKTKCGGTKASKACIFDYLATGDIKLAESSGDTAKESSKNLKIVENESPQLTGNVSIDATINEEVVIYLNAIDDGPKKPNLIALKQPLGFQLNASTGVAKWKPQNYNVSEISLVAEDDYGARSPSFDVVIRLCPGCNNGKCYFESEFLTTESRFYKVPCECNIGYTGEHCDENIDGCEDNPCPLGRNCTDLSPEDEGLFGRAFNCSECPSGYDEIDNKCQDINECLSNQTNDCNPDNQACANTDGGYLCTCISGFRKHGDRCIDINECNEMTSGCEQLCINKAGFFNCSCHTGYTLNEDRLTCRDSGISSCTEKHYCEYACIMLNETKKCICPVGYRLSANGQNCSDINECDLENMPCEQLCENTEGSFQCSCGPGYILNNDKTSCEECESPYYGRNCNLTCQCGPGAVTCDIVSGCVCRAGWRGRDCDQDMNECIIDPVVCGLSKLCVNTEGSYKCVCPEGFHSIGEECKDIDECANEFLNTCSHSTTHCQNAHGSYTCECNNGYQKKGNECEDINECETSLSECSQICENADDGYSCGCYFGFTLNEDRSHCIEAY
uniref:Mucin-like protein n=1 Tax=Crassostrea virginica TaxID=6565 RepID=A0A8B8AZR4_CRAVI|nr:mucin-like protein [Crassostrea virginica]